MYTIRMVAYMASLTTRCGMGGNDEKPRMRFSVILQWFSKNLYFCFPFCFAPGFADQPSVSSFSNNSSPSGVSKTLRPKQTPIHFTEPFIIVYQLHSSMRQQKIRGKATDVSTRAGSQSRMIIKPRAKVPDCPGLR